MLDSENSAPLPIDAPERRRLPLLLRHAWYSLNQAFRRRILHLGLTPDQFTVLRTLVETGDYGITQRELAEAISSDPNTIASLLERMESSQFVERRPDSKDRRARRLLLLPEGRRMYQLARNVAIELQTEILACLPEPERERFLSHLETLSEACRVAAENSPSTRRRSS